ncbi:putative phospholipid-transporting ATPase IIB [Portunus trituberculatus]|uniref:Putative phospholipid-transporting ATPase IIB n=1 Tax=Portunus trituberculatus TaxID=210409 RepID=A0A5B7JAS3_PORTR|nr:putative phospholipid-transporting ATPase IIB [Portunus trituberculatus]
MMHAAVDGDFEADESQYLLSDTDTETRTFRMTGTQKLCCLSYCVRNCLARQAVSQHLTLPCRLCEGLVNCCLRRRQLAARSVRVGHPTVEKFPANVIRNQKYNFITFIPLVSDKSMRV